MTNLLIVEDEDRIADFMVRGLKGEGFVTTRVADGESALALLQEDSFEVVLLDIMLPGISGHDVCSRMRSRKDFTPVLMLTALDGTDEKVAGLDKGADDYLAKPFDFSELVARINALRRRREEYDGNVENDSPASDEVTLDREGLCLLIDGERVELSSKEHDFMSLLIANSGKVLSRERILNSVWGLNEDPMTNTVDVYIRRLRKKLGSYSERIVSVRSIGYRYM